MNSERSSILNRRLLFLQSLLPGLFALLCGMLAVRPGDASEASGQSRLVAEPGVVIEKIEVGFDGLYKVGEWSPLWVTIRGSDARQVQIVVDAPDPDDNVTSLPGSFVDLKPGPAARFETCFRTGRLAAELQVEVRDSDGLPLATRRLRPASLARPPDSSAEGPAQSSAGLSDALIEFQPALKLDVPLWVTLGEFDLAASFADSAAASTAPVSANSESTLDPHLARLKSLGQLPTDSRALQSVDLLILPTARQAAGGESLLNQLTIEQGAVVQNWVRLGGHLLISIGCETAAFEKSPLAKWMPFVIEGQTPLRQLSGFESFAGRNAPLKVLGTIPAALLATLPRANVVLSDASNPHPLIASVPWGFGRVTIVAVDVDKPPLSNWPPLKSVLQKLARGGGNTAKTASRKTNRQLTHVGVTDLATQLQYSAEDFSGVRRSSYWWVMGLILLYVAVIGPLDYLLVHRLLRRPELTWFTFPILAGCSIAAAVWYSDRVNGRTMQVNQIDLVDIDSTSGTVRNNTLISLYSPQHERFSVAVEPLARSQFGKPETGSAGVHLSWMGVPENSVGGMYRLGGAGFGGRGYLFAIGSAAVEKLPVAHWSTKTLAAGWRSESTQPVVDCRLENLGTGQLRGTLTHHLGAPLEDCLIVASGWAYFPETAGGTLQPGREWALRGGKNVRELRAFLTGERQTRDKKAGSVTSEIITTAEPYNPLGRDLGRQVRMLTFHEAAGGSEYTGLAHAALRGLELTSLMQAGRGILIGRIASSPARVIVDGAPVEPADHSTWVRLVLPIVQSTALPDRAIPKASDTEL